MIVAVLVGYGVRKSVNNSSTELSELTLANVEALANGEDDKCTNKNGYRIWNHNGIVLKHFRDCCYYEQNGYNPQGCL